ncbi:SDR family NAD(P)-dependent oxidoreductase [Paraconexibacter antarcticus]|uniref:SDR family NAD(P)-dependent oxidoreductase n=1 Tax=Paraconexibacter antarcticus TaxID=2949664 RepID=A0ABY5DMJ5_9ACTN|nr:SDR family NAD(P)-dependent oxidoreductase [Paraconexibacter antarcticus]UTI63185.1 SDR family NAD(P)-dependent oxidoreductase [Paraconexibacter antarcticus]
MEIDLSGRVVAITGASSGIGEATAIACVQAGAAVALAARRGDRIDALAARINDEGGTAVAVPTDVGDERQARAFVEQAYERLGRLDALVNNAGVMLLGAVEGADTEQWRRMIDANLYGVLYCSHAALPVMRAQGGGHIVNVSSVAGRIASAGSAVYNMTKWGVNGFSEGLRQEALHAGIRVTIVEPGAVSTELIGHNSDAIQTAAASRFAGVTPLTAEDVANAIVYALEQPEHVSINEILVRPSRQER